MTDKFTVSTPYYTTWRSQGRTYVSLSDIITEYPRLRFAPGPDQCLYATNGNVLLKIEQYKSHYQVYYRNLGELFKKDQYNSDGLNSAKSKIPGQTIWFEPNNLGVSYGIDSEGMPWVIEELWKKV